MTFSATAPDRLAHSFNFETSFNEETGICVDGMKKDDPAINLDIAPLSPYKLARMIAAQDKEELQSRPISSYDGKKIAGCIVTQTFEFSGWTSEMTVVSACLLLQDTAFYGNFALS